MAQVTKTAYPSGLVDSKVSGSITNQNNPVGKGSGNTTYAQCNIPTGSGAEGYMTYGFNLSEIPESATIVSVSCSAKGYVSNTTTNRIATRQMQMFSGSTAKGSATTLTTSAATATMSVGTWTRSELQNARIRVYAKRGSSYTTTTYTLRFYGADLNVVYEYNDKRYLVKTGASLWSEVSKVFEKTASGMVERSLEAVMADIQNGKKMRYRGVYEGEVASLYAVTVNMYPPGSTSESDMKPYVVVNGTNVTTQGTFQVDPGSQITAAFGRSGPVLSTYTVVSVNGTEVARGGGAVSATYQYTVNSNISITVTDDTDCTIHIRTT